MRPRGLVMVVFIFVCYYRIESRGGNIQEVFGKISSLKTSVRSSKIE